ncbi:VPS33B [Bugula neritina]|uniref:VPS33B n=1 Tax=Bugula neritina TaxID=10212 RepID=A0A7J7K4P0_BUGNE|nr:VPS33B [Bugula neritina]
MAASVEGKLPNLDSLKKLVRDDLRRILESKHGAKDLFIDPTLMKPIDRIANVKFLQDHGVEKIYKIDSSKPVQGNRERFYITRPKVISIKYIVEQMKAEKSAGQDRHYTIVMVPRSLYICEKILEQNGVFGWVTIETLSFNLLPIDKDILTIELDFFYSSYFLHHDETWLHTAASALVALQQEFGKIPNFYAIGQAAKSTWQLSQTLLDCGPDITGVPKQIGHVILIDRDVDLVSPLCSQVTYEGLLDDIFGIQCGVVQFDKSVTGADNVMKVPLNSDDWLFQEVRNKHFSTVFKELSAKAKDLQKSYDKKDEMSVAQMKDFVAKRSQVIKGNS